MGQLIIILALLLGLKNLHLVKGNSLPCLDWQGKQVEEGQQYIPNKNDPCLTCTCEGGFPVMCTSVMCSPPNCKMWEVVEGECCKFNCIRAADDPSDKSRNNSNLVPVDPKKSSPDTANLGLRLVASTVTSFLILALMLFMVHRLRQRRMLIMMRRLNADRGDDDAVGYMSDYDQINMGVEFPPYEEPPPPYTPPKPPTVPPGEAPPPYEATEGEGNNNFPIPNGNTPSENGNPVRPSGFQNVAEANVTVPEQGIEMERLQQGSIPECINKDEQSHNCIHLTDRNIEAANTLRRSQLISGDIINNSDIMETDSNGQQVTITQVGNTAEREPSPSHVVVRMQNDNPQSTLVKGTVVPTSGDDKQFKNPRTHIIKKSDSIEIKRGNYSPRNSYISDHNTEVCNRGVSTGPSAWNHDELEASNSFGCSSRDLARCRGDRNLSGEKRANMLEASNSTDKLLELDSPKHRPFRIQPSDLQSSHGSEHWLQYKNQKPGDVEVSSNGHIPERNSPLEPNSQPGVYYPRQNQTRRELPPLDIGHTMNGHSSKGSKPRNSYYNNGLIASSTDSELSEEENENQNRHAHQGLALHEQPLSNAVPHNISSPLSPGGPFVRSASLGSQVSQFSVCSETGERRIPKNVPFQSAIRNDMTYPQVVGACGNVSDPLQLSQNQNGDQNGFDFDASNVNNGAGDRNEPHKNLPDLSFLSQNGTRSERYGNLNGCHGEEAHEQGSRSRSSSMKEDDMLNQAAYDTMNTDLANTHNNGLDFEGNGTDKNGTKKKKRKSYGNGIQQPVETTIINGASSLENTQPQSVNRNMSPERYRRLSKAWDSNARFKQYGFIDDPELVLSAIDNGVNTANSKTFHGSKMKQKRSTSCERKGRDGTGDRKKNMGQCKQKAGHKSRSLDRKDYRNNGNIDNMCENNGTISIRNQSRSPEKRQNRKSTGDYCLHDSNPSNHINGLHEINQNVDPIQYEQVDNFPYRGRQLASTNQVQNRTFDKKRKPRNRYSMPAVMSSNINEIVDR